MEDGLAAFPGFLHQAGEMRAEGGGRALDVVREAEAVCQVGELARQDEQAPGAEFGEGFAGGVGGDERMAVAVAAYPGAEAQARELPGVAEKNRVEIGVHPCLAQAAVEFRQSLGENLREVVHEVAPLGGHLGLAQEDLTRAPETFEGHLDLLAAIGEFQGGLARVLALLEQAEEAAVLLQRGGPLGLRGMRRQHGFHQDVRETGGDLLAGETGLPQAEEVRAPEPGFGGGSRHLLALATNLRGDVFLDEVEQLESGRIHLAEPRRQRFAGSGTVRRGGGRTVPVRPGNEAGEATLAEFLQDLPQTIHQEDEVFVDFDQTGFEQFGGWCAHPGGRLQGEWSGGKAGSHKKARGAMARKAPTGLYKDKPIR